jgi:aerobic-type carbon monoxide dehydrogenase small subunit (CoxS/CutS family)
LCGFPHGAGGVSLLSETRTDADGRARLVEGADLAVGGYRLEFAVADYFKGTGAVVSDPPFLDVVVIDFAVSDPASTTTCRCWSRRSPIPPIEAAEMGPKEQGGVRFLLNGEMVEAKGVDPTRTLLEHLRGDLRRTGTKEGCAEGDCGSCTVLVGELDGKGGTAWRAVNSCIQFVPMLDGKAVITVEGLAQGLTSRIPCRRRWSSITARSAGSARPASSCRCTGGPWRPRARTRRSTRCWPATCAAAPAMARSSRRPRRSSPKRRRTWPTSWRR